MGTIEVAGTPGWSEDVFRALVGLDVRQVAYVPDAGLIHLIEACRARPSMTLVALTSEEEGVALLAGAWLGGQRGVLLMQGSGIGNCVNMLSLTRTCRFGLLIIATMRGQEGEANPWQVPMGRIAGPVLDLAGVAVSQVEDATEAGRAVAEMGELAFSGPTAQAVLIAQKIIGAKVFAE
jgi:sulfopyruvate decarboxylase alpha subunit